MSIKTYPIIYLILFLFLQGKIKSEEIENNKYSFQLYNSHDTEKPYYFYAQANKNLIVINSTEGENNTIIETKTTNEYLYKEISSVTLIDDKYLVKTCFGPDNLMEVQYKNKETKINKNNNFSKIKFCYSSKIKNPFIRPINPDEYVIITYWAEISNITERERYSHKCILFYPSSNTFSEEFILSSESKSVVNLYYPEKCTTFRDEDIFCGIHFSPDNDNSLHIIGNHYIIETSKIFLDVNNFDSSIYLVVGNSVLSSTNYQIPIGLGKCNTIPNIRGYGDIYMSEFHNYNKDGYGKTLLLYSYYIKKLKNNFIRRNYIPYFETDKLFYGLNIQDKYIHQNLFNHLIPNKDELIIIYISKETKNYLFLSRFDINDSKSKLINVNFKELTDYNYIRNDICNEPKYLQSIYINSFINYDNNDKNIIKNNPNKDYYKYQRNIGVLISCAENNNVVYEPKKIEMPQCLNILDEINGNNKHILNFEEGQKEIIFDLYGDPNLFSLRNVKINFNNSALFTLLISIQVKLEGESNFKNIAYNLDYKTVTHIKFIKKYNLAIKEPIILPYRLKQNIINKHNIISQLVSDICKLEFSIENNNGQVCEIDFCIICKSESICESCNTNIYGLIKDNNVNSETYGKCICDESKGFKKTPDKEKNQCVCKDNYSFYLNISQCISNFEINKEPFYYIDNDITTNIKIYGDCYQTCKKCSKEGSKEEHNCDECKDGYIMVGNNCINTNIDTSSASYSYTSDTTKETDSTKETHNSKETDATGETDISKESDTTSSSYSYNSNKTKETDTSLDSINVIPIHKKVNDNDVCLYDEKIWFQLGKYKFYYTKIDKCIFIYDGIELFFISNKVQCKNLVNNYKYTIANISECLNNFTLDNKLKYINFIENAKEYNPNSNNITIYKYIETEKKYFHIYNSHINYKNISTLYFDDNIKMDFLIFKVDIKRDDTISTQVEYQFYNPKPENIYEKIDINDYLSKKRRLQNNNNNFIYLDLPISLQQEKLAKIKELNSLGIDAFNSSSEFYVDICNQYTTPNKDDIYLEERKKEYYPDEQYCEENCEFIKYNFDTEKVTCKCSPKENSDNFKKVKFKYNDKDEKFKAKILSPNLKTIKCWPIFYKTLYKNIGLYLSLFLFISFLLLFLYRIFIGESKVKKDLDKLKSRIESNKNIKKNGSDEKNPEQLKESDIKNEISSIKITDSVKSSINNSSLTKRTIPYGGNNPKNDYDNNSNKEEGNLHEKPKDEKRSNGQKENNNDQNENNNIKINEKDFKVNDGNEHIKNDNSEGIQNKYIRPFKNQDNRDDKNEKDKFDKKKENNSLVKFVTQSLIQSHRNNNLNINNNKNKNNIDKNNNNINNNNNHNIEKMKESILESKVGPPIQNLDYSQDTVFVQLPKDLDNVNSIIEPSKISDSSKPNNSIQKSSSLIDEAHNEDKNKENHDSSIQNSIQKSSALIDETHNEDKIKESESKMEAELGVININEELKNNNDVLIDCDESAIDKNGISTFSLSVEDEVDEKDKNANSSNIKKNTMIQKEKKKKRIPKSEKEKRDKERQKRKDEKEKEKSIKNVESIKVANPPKNINIDMRKSENKELKENENEKKVESSERKLIGKKKEKLEINENDYVFDTMDYNQLIENKDNGRDNRKIYQMFLSVLKSNSTLYYTFSINQQDDIFLRFSILILCISFYICLNVFLSFNMSMVQVYTNFKFGYFTLNIFIPCIISLPIILIRKFMSKKKLLYEVLQLEKNKDDLNIFKNAQRSCKNIDIAKEEEKISIKGKELIEEIDNYKVDYIYLYGSSGLIFLFFNLILLTSFCGNYPNTVIKLFKNTFASMIGSFMLSAFFYLVGVILRYYSLKNKMEILYNISRFFNPLYLSCNDINKMICKTERKKEPNLHEKPDEN